MDIAQRIAFLKKTVPEYVTLIAVSKTQPLSRLMEVYNSGIRNFGENKAREIGQKHLQMPSDVIWHFIGHLQTNKVKFIAPFIQMIHSVDSLNLLREINKEAGKNERIIACLLQFHIASEETKFGLNLDEARRILDDLPLLNFKNVKITGVMGMASFSNNNLLVRQEFTVLTGIFRLLKLSYFNEDADFKTISMGMSGDYKLAIEEGSNMVRIGTSIFGER